MCGCMYVCLAFVESFFLKKNLKKKQLRSFLKKYATTPFKKSNSGTFILFCPLALSRDKLL
jgi:hypothetical protein